MESSELRADAARVLLSLLERGRSLGDALPDDAPPLLREIVLGVTRWYWRLQAELNALLKKPLRRKDRDLEVLLLIGLYQLRTLSIPAHAAINETVNASALLGKEWARGLVNGVLRSYVRRGPIPEARLSDVERYSHPQWLVRHIRKTWPEYWPSILEGNNERAPMVLRVNRLRTNRETYLETLQRHHIGARSDRLSEDGVILDRPVSIQELPGFHAGLVSVQDSAAQWAAPALPVLPGDRILDACSAPGGKLTHLLERYPGIRRVVAIEVSSERAAMVRANLRRLDLSAEFHVGDAADPAAWWDGTPFDGVLLDAPCSGSGVIRRHPDIKHLRRPEDLEDLASRQRLLLDRLWRTVAPGGHLLYVTCSILLEENDGQIGLFLSDHRDAHVLRIQACGGQYVRYGLQTLPGVHNVDGFYYALLKKNEETPNVADLN